MNYIHFYKAKLYNGKLLRKTTKLYNWDQSQVSMAWNTRETSDINALTICHSGGKMGGPWFIRQGGPLNIIRHNLVVCWEVASPLLC